MSCSDEQLELEVRLTLYTHIVLYSEPSGEERVTELSQIWGSGSRVKLL